MDIKANKDNELKYRLELEENKEKEKDNIIKESKEKEEVIEYFTE